MNQVESLTHLLSEEHARLLETAQQRNQYQAAFNLLTEKIVAACKTHGVKVDQGMQVADLFERLNKAMKDEITDLKSELNGEDQ